MAAPPPLRAYHVALAALLRLHLAPAEDDPIPGSGLYRALENVLLEEARGGRGSPATPDLVTLLRHIQEGLAPHGQQGEERFEAVKQALGEALSSLEVPDDLLTALDGLRDLVNNCTSEDTDSAMPGADANSALGLLLRQLFVSYAAMPFETLCRLLADVQAYFNDAVTALQAAGAGEGLLPEQQQQRLLPLRSEVELDRFLDARLAELDQQVGVLAQGVLEAPLEALDTAAPTATRTSLARHLSSLRHRDLAASLDHLHRYFDRLGSQGQPPRISAAAGAEGEGGEAAAGGGARLQGASLSLGSMHAQFGHMEEAMAALNETVRIAQQSSDDTCLAHALASLCQILDAVTPGAITSVGSARGKPPAARHHAQLAQLLQRCLKRAEELQLPHLVAYALLALARFELLHGQAVAGGGDTSPRGSASSGAGGGGMPGPHPAAPAVALALRDAAHLHLASAMAAALPAAPPMASGLAAARVLRGAPELFGGACQDVFGLNTAGQQAACAAEVEQLAAGAHLLRACCWELCGSRSLAQAHALCYLDTYSILGRAEDQCAALAALAVSVAAGAGPAAAEEVLAAAAAAFPYTESRALAMARLSVAHDRALARHRLNDALALAQQMTGLACPTDATDIVLRLEAEERLARTLLAQGDVEGAAKAAHALFAMAAETGQPVQAARLLLLLGRVHAAAGAPLAALPYALSAAAHCRGLGLDLLCVEATLLLAELWLDMGGDEGVARAHSELEDVLQLVLAHGSLDLRGRVQLALAEAVLAGARSAQDLKSSSGEASNAVDASWALELLEGAGAAFRMMEDWQQTARAEYVRALALDALGRPEERNAAAAEHHRLQALRSVD